jgi:hypothetical protein
MASQVMVRGRLGGSLHFISVVADLARQFEFIQRQWLNDPNFPNGSVPPGAGQPYGPPTPGEPGDGPDPLVGEFDAGSPDALHQPSGGHQFAVNQELVSVSAGEYFFAPSLVALQRLADGATTSTPTAGSPPKRRWADRLGNRLETSRRRWWKGGAHGARSSARL